MIKENRNIRHECVGVETDVCKSSSCSNSPHGASFQVLRSMFPGANVERDKQATSSVAAAIFSTGERNVELVVNYKMHAHTMKRDSPFEISTHASFVFLFKYCTPIATVKTFVSICDHDEALLDFSKCFFSLQLEKEILLQ